MLSLSQKVEPEAYNLGQLKHDNVVKLFGVWETPPHLGSKHSLVMEFAHGGPLHSVVRARPSVYPTALINWALQVAEGMQYLHVKANIRHCDLKTANSK